MNPLIQDMRYALRQLRESPVFMLTAVLTLALGIGANTTVFTVVYATLLAPMPYPQPNQLVGIYGVMAFMVAPRGHEIGLRMPLGASGGNVVSLILKDALVLALPGLGLGLSGEYFVGRAMQSTLYGVGSLDFAATAIVAVVLLCACLLASWLPAYHASAVEPMKALRNE